jgi:hypothetical protein
MPDEPPLRAATPDDVAESLACALRFRNGRPHAATHDVMAQVTARWLVEHLERSNFVLMRKTEGKLHST